MSASKIITLVSFLSLLNPVLAAPSQACKLPNRSPIDWRPKANETRVFQIGTDPENPREIRVSVPPLYNGTGKELPLILAFHDKEQSPAQFEYETRFGDKELNRDKIVVYPKAVNDTWQSDITVSRFQKSKKSVPSTDDVTFTRTLIKDLDTVICFDTTRVYATGLGTGGGLVHLLACDPVISTQLAAYAIVAGGFGTKSISPIWAECNPARLPAPILEIHGEEDKILPYMLNDWEPAKSRRAVPHWLDDWSERNGCGEAISEPIEGMDGTGTPVSVTKLEKGGWISEAEAWGGGILRTAKSCPILDEAKATEAKEGKAIKSEKDASEDADKEAIEKLREAANEESGEDSADEKDQSKEEEMLKTDPAHFTLLHYRIRDFGHGWPLQQIKGMKGSKEDRLFDATKIVTEWFSIHNLPEPEVPAEEKRETVEGGEEGEVVDDVDDEEEEEVLEAIHVDAADVAESTSTKKEKIKQSLEEEHDEL
ncbi:hypothetical protein EG327_003076 [Venturia inaequalis]|uniref:feruloyl esterase n=1 Tax=Venturia inaequalis TaxID=5025 RepID=A0A8H3VSR3_VENIN|nr:hypothetical protein EG327_003076 [Venturia inaequalis]